ncbi:MAG: 1,4-dihydroxy-6-naphthoate synthase, partial [Acidobacteria bacterium]|nr:1,4-dihydroxy-6-naphthoate synthase [Acidobacteriota bacterium]
RRDLDPEVQTTMERVLRRSVEYAFAHRDHTLPYVRAHAQDMDDEVMFKHIDLYVNDFSVDLGSTGRAAVHGLFDRACAAGVIPPVTAPLFLD